MKDATQKLFYRALDLRDQLSGTYYGALQIGRATIKRSDSLDFLTVTFNETDLYRGDRWVERGPWEADILAGVQSYIREGERELNRRRSAKTRALVEAWNNCA